jgi:hypothetical protein
VAAHADVTLRGTQWGLWSQLQWIRTAPTRLNRLLNLHRRNVRAVIALRRKTRGQAIIAKIQKATDLSNENCDRARALPHRLSMQLSAAED